MLSRQVVRYDQLGSGKSEHSWGSMLAVEYYRVHVTGTLKSWNVRSVLVEIRGPVLVTVAEFDEVGPELIRQSTAAIPGARFEVLAGAAHITPWDARDENLRIVREFLRSADTDGTRPQK